MPGLGYVEVSKKPLQCCECTTKTFLVRNRCYPCCERYCEEVLAGKRQRDLASEGNCLEAPPLQPI